MTGNGYDSLFSRLLPTPADNTYRGYKLALWLFGLVVLMRVMMSLNSIFNARFVASSADGIPVETYAPAAAQTAVSLFALLGLSNFLICALCILVLVRYRSLVPLMFTVLVVHFLSGRVILHFLPIVRSTPRPTGLYVNLGLLAVMLVGLALSLGRGNSEMQQQRASVAGERR